MVDRIAEYKFEVEQEKVAVKKREEAKEFALKVAEMEKKKKKRS